MFSERNIQKKRSKKNINIVAMEIINNSENDLIFGNNINITNADRTKINLLDNKQIFKPLKQNVATYFLYLLLTPINFFTTSSDEYRRHETTSSVPIGLVIGPGVTAINTITAASANKKFKKEI